MNERRTVMNADEELSAMLLGVLNRTELMTMMVACHRRAFVISSNQ
jgi:hypothetical protein